jgi:transcriptional regulator with XRE-family HTH domain
MSYSSDSSGDTFSRCLDHLFTTVTHPNGCEYTYEEVENGTQRAVSAYYVWRLRTGRANNPSYRVINVLSHFFGVTPAYFFHRDKQVEDRVGDMVQNNLVNCLHDPLVFEIIQRASRLNEKGRQAVLLALDFLEQS